LAPEQTSNHRYFDEEVHRLIDLPPALSRKLVRAARTPCGKHHCFEQLSIRPDAFIAYIPGFANPPKLSSPRATALQRGRLVSDR
jgi:hypothetical protein